MMQHNIQISVQKSLLTYFKIWKIEFLSRKQWRDSQAIIFREYFATWYLKGGHK